MAERDLRLLCLDGGGFRGLSTLLILKRLMEAIQPDNPPKPCDYFDMIGGSGTGGLIAIMLGRLQMDVESCIQTYTSAIHRVFGTHAKSRRPPFGTQFKTRYESAELERTMKECFLRLVGGARGSATPSMRVMDQPLMRDGNGLDVKCKVFVCATSKQSGEPALFTSYRSPRHSTELFRRIKIWEAARATCANPSCFEPIILGDDNESYFDSPMDANPIRHLQQEVCDTLLKPGETLGQRVGCLVSIGAGRAAAQGRTSRGNGSSSSGGSGGSGGGWSAAAAGSSAAAAGSWRQKEVEGDDLVAREAERAAAQFEGENDDLLANGQYFRFTVNKGLERMGLDQALKKHTMITATRNYLRQPQVRDEVEACAKSLQDCWRGFM